MQVYAEGTHIMVPWFERPVLYDVRARPSVIQSQSGSKDLQMVRLGDGKLHRSSTFQQLMRTEVWKRSRGMVL